jgi:hypothetical protein
MTNLTANQIELLRVAAGAEDAATDMPDGSKIVRALIKRALLIALPQAEGPSRLLITEAGRAVLAAAQTPLDLLGEEEQPMTALVAPPSTPKGKLGILVTLLRAPDGATVAAMAVATGWQSHSVRGALSGSLKKKLCYTIASEQTEAGRVYRIVEAVGA